MKQKINKYFLIITGLAALILLFSIIRNPYYATSLFFASIYLIDNRDRIKPAIVTLGFFTIIDIPATILFDYWVFNDVFRSSSHPFQHFFVSFFLTIPIIMLPFYFINQFFIKVLVVANTEKDNYNVISKFPDVICKEHLRKTQQFTLFGFKGVHCRVSKKCFSKNNIIGSKLVGLIGEDAENDEDGSEYFVTLWKHNEQEINDADYDIIEIHENDEIEAYDAVLNKIINYFYNELNRYKPIKEVLVRIVGQPAISENTIRLMKEKFLRVDFLAN